MLQLVRATCHNGIFRQVSDQWRAQIIEYNDVLEPEDYFPTMMEHAAKIAEEVPPDRNTAFSVWWERRRTERLHMKA